MRPDRATGVHATAIVRESVRRALTGGRDLSNGGSGQVSGRFIAGAGARVLVSGCRSAGDLANHLDSGTTEAGCSQPF